ncbi:pyrroline-5-carboxylate reductase family protein [Roseibium aggregatum]|uniref:Pyrroline-5-carboxylate reductase n=1 Tax=Roseibium aggregatum TaxID=187304 RepID=A0A926S6M5_9HYPH|nr:pyrroline-5-carboxylate reductase dimerization domain-containing protein [Roseibium aggregatum]MBD1548708.1 NAD(P)-binding domain-containing protein [Roseibium aggregatum]
MTTPMGTVGIIGGSGMLGRAIAHALLRSGTVAPERFWISNRSGSSAGFEAYPAIHITTNNQELVEACDTVLLSVPPKDAPAIGINAGDKLVASVMAGVSLQKLQELTGSVRVVRAMSSPAAEFSLAYSPWTTSAAVTGEDRNTITTLFGACGATDEVPDEAQIEIFTAITGPVPGFVAYFAACMSDYAVTRGIDPAVADKSIRQLFLAAGHMLAESTMTPGGHVQQMIDYAGTTAAGLNAMASSDIADAIAAALDAAVEKTRQMG